MSPIGSLNQLALLAWFLECQRFLRRIFIAPKCKTASKNERENTKTALNRNTWATLSLELPDLSESDFRTSSSCSELGLTKTRYVLQSALPDPSRALEQMHIRPISRRFLLGFLLVTKWFLTPCSEPFFNIYPHGSNSFINLHLWRQLYNYTLHCSLQVARQLRKICNQPPSFLGKGTCDQWDLSKLGL